MARHGILVVAFGLSIGTFGVMTAIADDDERVTQEEMLVRQPHSIAGLWSADAFSIGFGPHATPLASRHGQTVSLTVSKTRFTLRAADTVFADFAYTLDTTKSPWEIDLTSAAGKLLGLCSIENGTLRMLLADEAKGRPEKLEKTSEGMWLVLQPFATRSLFTVNADGSDLKPILSMSDFTNIGSPDVSHDGSRIALDGWKTLYGEEFGDVKMLVVHRDGSGVKLLGAGAMPSWSPDDKQITFCVPGQGVWIMNADGTERRCIAQDAWGSQWSPNRNEIAIAVYEDGGANLYLYDAETGKRRGLLTTHFGQIYWGVSWSPDGAWVCFKGVCQDGKEQLVAVSTAGQEKGYKVILPDAMPELGYYNNTVAWGGSQILLSLAEKGKNQDYERLRVFDLVAQQAPQVFPQYPEGYGRIDMAWTPDFQQVVFTATPPIAPAKAK